MKQTILPRANSRMVESKNMVFSHFSTYIFISITNSDVIGRQINGDLTCFLINASCSNHYLVTVIELTHIQYKYGTHVCTNS